MSGNNLVDLYQSFLKTPFIWVALIGLKNQHTSQKKKSVSRKVAINLKHIMHLWQLRSDTFEPLMRISQIF